MGAGGSVESLTTAEPKPGPVPVSLHIYDVGLSKEVHLCNRVLKTIGTGIFHCGVEVHGSEWGFEAKGIFQCRPRQCRGHSYKETLPMGDTVLSHSQVLQLMTMLTKDWEGRSYDLLKHNCCHFANELCHWLGVGSVPNWVTNLAGAGAMVADTGHNLEAVCCQPLDCNKITTCEPFKELTNNGEGGSWTEVLALGFCGLCSNDNAVRGMQAMHVAQSISPKGWTQQKRSLHVAPQSMARSQEPGVPICGGCMCTGEVPPEYLDSPAALSPVAKGPKQLRVDQESPMWTLDDNAQVDLDPMEMGRLSYAGRMNVPRAVEQLDASRRRRGGA